MFEGKIGEEGMKTHYGKFIVIEGTDGTGKSFQASLKAASFTKMRLASPLWISTL